MKRYRLRSSYGLSYKGYWQRPRLTLDEANERVQRYYPSMTILNYIKSSVPAEVYCSDCGEIYETKNTISGYMYGYRKKCEMCTYKELLCKYNNYLKHTNIKVKHWHSKNGRTYAQLHCTKCETNWQVMVQTLPRIRECQHCSNNKKTMEYISLLERHDCIYLSRETIDDILYIKYKCKKCGNIGVNQSSKFLNRNNPCPECNPNSINNIKNTKEKELKEQSVTRGKLLLDYKDRDNVTLRHLFCGSTYTTRGNNITRALGCRQCQSKTQLGTAKAHNKHLVKEYLKVLYNIKKVKDIIEEHNQLDNFPEGEVKIILEHIDGWISNYKEIMKQYPNGDLGTVLENNPLYERCKEIFYPVMDKFGIERIE